MAAARRLNISLDPQYAERLSQKAARAHVADGTLARSLLSTAIDEADPDGTTITEILESIPGSLQRIEHAEAQIEQGSCTALDDLRDSRRRL